MNHDTYDAAHECAHADLSLMDNDNAYLLAQADPANYACAVAPVYAEDPPSRAQYACLQIPLLAPVDQLLRSATLLFVFAAWLFNSDIMLFFAFATLCVNMCLCCGKPAVGCWMADILIAGVLLLVLLLRDTGYVVHLVFHGAANETHTHAD